MNNIGNKTCEPELVIFLPDWRVGNPYQSLLAAGIETYAYHVDFLQYDSKALLPINAALRNHHKPDIVHLHWLNNYFGALFWSSNSVFFYLRLLLIILDITLLKIRKIKVVWTVHNLIAHESPNPEKELIARKVIARLCRVVVHSEGARSVVSEKYGIKKEALSVVPHGSYVGYYPTDTQTNQDVAQQLSITTNKINFLFLGAIRRYKGVNDLVEAFLETTNASFNLVVAGKPFEEDDKLWLEQKAQEDTRIKLSLGFIPDNELSAYLNCCDVVVLPFVNTLTSGSAILAMSYGKALILPETGRVFSLPDEGVIYYSKTQGLTWALEESAKRNLADMGASNLRYAQALDFNHVAKLLVDTVYH